MSEEVFSEWNDLREEYRILEENNVRYLKQLKELTSLQQVCLKGIEHQKYRMKSLQKSLNTSSNKNGNVQELKKDMMKREAELEAIERTLPKKTGRYLRLVLGNIDVSFLNKDDIFKYKDEYEKFKLVIHVLAFISVCLLFYFPYRPLELVYMSFLIWYYCTVTIRESILKANGSKIKGWWRIHHIISTGLSTILLVWPDNEIWTSFRKQFLWYNIYTCFITYLQFKYQHGALYRLKALGERDNMDITIEGFHSWMWRGLTFLLPFLFVGYIYQLANAVVLYRLSSHPLATWQVWVTSVAFLVLFMGNTITTMMVIPNKIKQKMMFRYRILIGKVIKDKKR